MTLHRFSIALAGIAITASMLFSSCGRNPNDTGTEFASQMYHSRAYEDYTQIIDTTSEDYNSAVYNAGRLNMRKPPKHSISRKNYEGTPRTVLAANIMEYPIPHPDSMGWSERNLTNPLPATPKNLEEGKVLYTRYCAACHGAEGKGNGKVAEQYKGVPSYSAGRVATVNGGHIYHTITYGKGRMWPHGTQVMPDERWKIVQYVQTLQKQK
jgi:mono/diheme cytochrome c family protein